VRNLMRLLRKQNRTSIEDARMNHHSVWIAVAIAFAAVASSTPRVVKILGRWRTSMTDVGSVNGRYRFSVEWGC